MRSFNLSALGIAVSVGEHSSHAWLGEPADDSFTLVGKTLELLRDLWHGERVKFLAVTLFELSPPNRQVDFGFQTNRRLAVSRAVDLVKDKYGDRSVAFGSMILLDDEAPDRIGFRKTEGVDIIRTA